MGLDIKIVGQNEYVRIGNYRYVHKLRKQLIEATIAHLKQEQTYEQQKSQCRELLQLAMDRLQVWITPAEPMFLSPLLEQRLQIGSDMWFRMQALKHPGDINYEAITESTMEWLIDLDLCGLYYFVQHSDCEGSWDVDQCEQIGKMFDILLPYAIDQETKKHWNDIRDKFVEAANMKTEVECR